MYLPTALALLGALTFSPTTTSNALSANVAHVDHSTPRHDEGTRVLRVNETKTEEGEEERMVPYYNFFPILREEQAVLEQAEAINQRLKSAFWGHFSSEKAKAFAVKLLRQTTAGKEVAETATPEQLFNAVAADDKSCREFMELHKEALKKAVQVSQLIRELPYTDHARAAEVDETMLQGWWIDEAELGDKQRLLAHFQDPYNPFDAPKLRHMAVGMLYPYSSKGKSVMRGEGTSSSKEGVEEMITRNEAVLQRLSLKREVVMEWVNKIYDNEHSKLTTEVIVDMGIGKAFEVTIDQNSRSQRRYSSFNK
ncbi:hypothetical protein PsorP6_016304 [Peronosclerospora sorghi]|uniref:Uncharacterized protein n=1 Tax=Peronosclerospora sorghi TaxID=230839 RepID=A0ACC0VNR4_9STRA|nr:hypothetical protein PsorP6_016304 [Peronosclerospora sorghi]